MTVTGTIGNQPVVLNNAATESTLQLLLQAIQGSAGAGAAQQVASTAAIAGINTAGPALNNAATAATGMARASQLLGTGLGRLNNAGDLLRTSFEGLEKNIGALTSKLMQGSAGASDVYDVFTKIPGVVGAAATVFQKVAKFQEENLATYQQISSAGVNFGGSLTQMRMAAQNSYVTLQEFTNLMKNNGETFAKMGSNANDGAMAFSKLSKSLLSSEVGTDLRALGYTTEQVNQGMLNYISITGGRTKEELKNTKDLAKGASEYLTQLDALAVITGKSREEQEKQLKEASANAAYEAYLQTLDEEGRKKATLAMQNALATGGKGGADLLKSQLLGLPPMTEAAQKLQALGPNVAAGIKDMGTAVQSVNGTVQDVNKGYAKAQAGATQDIEKFGKTAGALSFGTDATSQALMGMQAQANKNKANGIKNQEDAEKQLAQVTKNQKERQESEAKAAVEAQKAIQEMGQALMAMLLPAIEMLTPVVNTLTSGLGTIISTFGKMEGAGKAVIAAFIGFQAFKRIGAGAGGGAAGAPGLGGVLGGVLGGGVGPLGSLGNPMHVIIVRSLPGAAPGPQGQGRGTPVPSPAPTPGTPTPGSPSPAPGTPQRGPSKMGRLAGGVGGIVGGLALDAASAKLTETGNEKAGAGVSILGDAATWAGTGAMLGPWGALAGGIAGGAYGLYKNWDKLFGEEKPKMAAGGIVTQPTNVLAGEAGSEAIIPLKHLESLRAELETLNKSTIELIRYMRETADYTKKNVDATKGLSGDLFKF